MNKLSNDSAANVDVLNREKFAKQIVKSLIYSFEKVEESIVVGICGKWGSGKTTLLNFIQKHIENEYKGSRQEFRTLNFNSWAHTEENELERALLEKILKELESIQWKTKVEESNSVFKKYLKHLNYLKFIKHIHPVTEKIFDAVDEYTNEIQIHSLDDLKEKINSLIIENEIKLFVLIDDIDRLEPREISQIFKALKLNLNYLNTFYIVAYDKEVVISALEQQYSGNAEKYLEKIIQVDFTVPEILEEDLEMIFFDKLGVFTSKFNLEINKNEIFQIWKNKGLREYFFTLRDIKRYFNSLIFSLPNIGNEINVGDFLTLEAIKVFDFKAYETLYIMNIEIKRKAMWESISFGNSIIDKMQNNTTSSLLKYLFTDNKESYRFGEIVNKKRLRDYEYFERYFSLNIARNDVTEEMIKNTLLKGINRPHIFSEIYDAGKITNLMRRLSEPDLNSRFKIEDKSIFKQFLDFWDSHQSDITSDIEKDLRECYFNIANSFHDKYSGIRESLINLVLRENDSAPARYFIVNYIIKHKEDNPTSPIFSEELSSQIDSILKELKEAFIKHLYGTGSSCFYQIGIGRDTHFDSSFIYAFTRFNHGEYIKCLERYIENANFISFITRHKLMNNNNNNSGILDLDNITLYFPNEFKYKFESKLREIKRGELNDVNYKLIEYFRQEYFKIES